MSELTGRCNIFIWSKKKNNIINIVWVNLNHKILKWIIFLLNYLRHYNIPGSFLTEKKVEGKKGSQYLIWNFQNRLTSTILTRSQTPKYNYTFTSQISQVFIVTELLITGKRKQYTHLTPEDTSHPCCDAVSLFESYLIFRTGPQGLNQLLNLTY